jgi:hypothetical protein
VIKLIDFYSLFENGKICRTIKYDLFCLNEKVVSNLINQNLSLGVGSKTIYFQLKCCIDYGDLKITRKLSSERGMRTSPAM